MYSRADSTLEKLEGDISEGILGSGKLAQWKAEEAEWLSKVVKQDTHKTLDNPYEPKKEKRKCFASNVRDMADHLRYTGLTQKQALAEIGAKMLSSSVVSAGLLGVLEEGIGLEESRYGGKAWVLSIVLTKYSQISYAPRT